MSNKKYFVNEHNTNEDVSAPGAERIYVSGAGGGGKGGGASRAAVEAPNTLRSAAVARIVELISAGPIEGIAGGPKGIYIDNVPLQSPSGTYNFPRVEWDYRVGLPSQDYLPGFSAVEAEVLVNTPVTIVSNNIVQSVSAANIDAVRVTIQLPQGLSQQNTTNGDVNGTSVQFSIARRLAAGTWSTVGTYTITGKTLNAYEAQYRIERPTGSGLWEVRVTRITADPNASTRNNTTFARMTEIQDVKVSYPNSAVVGIAIDAESVGNEIPKRAYLVKGVLVKIPSNYNPSTRAYTGVWDGLLVNSTVAVDNPAWVLYDMLTNDIYGAGIDPDTIDRYSFYDAGVYCDELVSYTDELGVVTQEPRFTFNARIADRPDMVRLVRAVAGAMNGSLIWVGGKWTVIQDRPTESTKLITKFNTLRSKGFIRRSSKGDERHTAVNISFNDRTDRYLERVVAVEDTTAIGRYGYNPIDIAAFGCTTEGQAIRAGKWLLDTELNQTQMIEFDMSINGFDLKPGDVVTVFDDDYANVYGSGRISSVVGTTVTLKDAVTLSPSSKITVLLADGFTLEERNITETTGTLSTVTINSAFSQAVLENADFVITSAVSPQQYRIIDIYCPEAGIVTVKAVNYDPLKFSRVETGVALPVPVFSNTYRTTIEPPTSIEFFEEALVLPSGAPSRNLRVEWTPPTIAPKSYLVIYTVDESNEETREVSTAGINIQADRDGVYAFKVFSRDFTGVLSNTYLSGTYTFTSGGSTLIPGFSAVQNLYVENTAGTSWSTDDLVVIWSDNSSNTVPAQDYKVEVMTTGDVVLETAFTTAKRYTYPFARNVQQGGPRGSLKVRISARDAANRFANPTTATFTNAVPAAVSGISTVQSFKSAIVKWTPNTTDKDIQGYLVWRGTTAGFTTDSASLVFDGLANEYTDTGLADSTTYYYKIAAYDKFSRNVNGTGLNVSSSVSVLTLAADKTNEYRVSGVTWTPNDPGSNQVSWTACTVIKSLGVSSGTTWSITAGNATWTSGVLYVYYTEGETIFRTTTTLATAIADNKVIVATYRGGTNLEIGDGRAFTDGSLILAGTVGASQLVVGSAVITQTAQIANTIITDAKIASATITGAKIASATITDANIANAAITNAKIANLAVTTGKIADLSVSSLKIADRAVTIPVYSSGSTRTVSFPTATWTYGSWIDLVTAAINIDYVGPGGTGTVVQAGVQVYFAAVPSSSTTSQFSGAVDVRLVETTGGTETQLKLRTIYCTNFMTSASRFNDVGMVLSDYINSTSTGVRTFALQVRPQNRNSGTYGYAAADLYLYNPSLLLLGAKK